MSRVTAHYAGARESGREGERARSGHVRFGMMLNGALFGIFGFRNCSRVFTSTRRSTLNSDSVNPKTHPSALRNAKPLTFIRNIDPMIPIRTCSAEAMRSGLRRGLICGAGFTLQPKVQTVSWTREFGEASSVVRQAEAAARGGHRCASCSLAP